MTKTIHLTPWEGGIVVLKLPPADLGCHFPCGGPKKFEILVNLKKTGCLCMSWFFHAEKVQGLTEVLTAPGCDIGQSS